MSAAAAPRRSVIAALALAGLAIAPAAAHAWDPADFKGGAILHYDLTYVDRRAPLGSSAHDEAAPPAAEAGLAMAGVRLHGFFTGAHGLGYFGGLALHAGSTVGGRGFAYQTDLYLLGIAARFGRVGFVGVGAGVGASGAVGTLDDGVDLPAEAMLELALGDHLRVLARARAVWLGAAPGRDRGAPRFTWTDEVEGSLALRLGRRYHDFGFPTGNGSFVGVAYREAEGARYLGLTLGYSVDLGTR